MPETIHSIIAMSAVSHGTERGLLPISWTGS